MQKNSLLISYRKSSVSVWDEVSFGPSLKWNNDDAALRAARVHDLEDSSMRFHHGDSDMVDAFWTLKSVWDMPTEEVNCFVVPQADRLVNITVKAKINAIGLSALANRKRFAREPDKPGAVHSVNIIPPQFVNRVPVEYPPQL